MARIDIKTLVLAFEKRIEALEKNPPDKVPTSVIINMIEKTIDDVINKHFIGILKKDLEGQVRKELKNMHIDFVQKTVTNILSNQLFRDQIENKLKNVLLESVSRLQYPCEEY